MAIVGVKGLKLKYDTTGTPRMLWLHRLHNKRLQGSSTRPAVT